MALPDWLRISPVSGKGAGAVSVEADPITLTYIDAKEKKHAVTLTVTQAGRREPFGGSDTDFILSDDGTLNVLKGE